MIGEISRDANVVPLAYHVDYWNHLGWSDPFSSRASTQRQMAYVRTFHLDGAYTPQAVVNGETQLIGSDARGLRASILAESRRPAEASVAIRTAPGGRVHVTASSQRPHVDVVLAIVEDGIVTNVPRGENAGRMLRNDFVVRRTRVVGAAPVDADVSLDLDPAWKNVHVVAFAQDHATLRIYGAASVALPSPRGSGEKVPRGGG